MLRRYFSIFFLILLSCLLVPFYATAEQTAQLEVFVRDNCPHCASAKEYLPQLLQQRESLQIKIRQVDHDEKALDDLIRYSRFAGIWPPGVPSFVIEGRILVGFDTPERTGPKLSMLLNNRPSPEQHIVLPLIGSMDITDLGFPLFTLVIGLLDGLNPCAMWVLLFLLSLLVHLQDRRRMALIAGTFVLVSGAVYFLFISAWLNLLQWVGLSSTLRWILVALALLIATINISDFFRRDQNFTLSIPASAKPKLYSRMRHLMNTRALTPALLGVATLAVVVNGVELLCTAGFPAMYTAILVQQELTPLAHYGYLGIYILGYIADDALMVTTAVLALSSRKLTDSSGRWLKLISGIVMACLAAVMLWQPAWLF